MSPFPRRLLAQLLAGGAYVVATKLTLATALHAGVVAMWPPAGVGLLALVVGGMRLWPGLLAGAFVAKLVTGYALMPAAGCAVGEVLEALVCVLAVGRLMGDARSRVHDLGALGALAAGVALSAVIGVTSLRLAGRPLGPDWITAVARWTLGDVIGMLLLAPPAAIALLWRTRVRPVALCEGVLVVAAATAEAIVLFRHPDGQLWLLVAPVVWIVLRRGLRTAFAASVTVSLVAVIETVDGHGPFATGGPHDLLMAQGFSIVLSAATLTLTALTEERRRVVAAHARMADEDAALRRVATAVAAGASLRELGALVSREVASLLGTESGVVSIYEDGGRRVRVIGRYSADGHLPDDETFDVVPGGVTDLVYERRAPARLDERDAPSRFMPPYVQRVAAPVNVSGALWGVIVANAVQDRALPADAEQRVGRFAELVGIALANADAHAQLLAQATTDPLTGLLNHRAFHERLREEAAVAQRQGTPLALAVFDLDRFKQVNDTLGHVVGDRVLAEASRRMARSARTGEAVARIGGDEIALLMPGTGAADAHAAAERVRRAAAAAPFDGVGTMTVSAGVCDLEQARTPDDLLRLADGALYWAKAHGRDACIRYTPEVVEELSATERADRLEQARGLAALTALARAIDAKDHATIRHSQRVADMAAALAQECGWSCDAARRLHDAGLLHDVGKIGVPDAILSKPGRLTGAEHEVVRRHADLGARIVAGVLDADQVAWVRGHHERHDGGGYPDGLGGTAIPEGARLLALADAWDAMTGARAYSAAMAPEDALAEVRRCDGRQFHPDAVAALEQLYARGEVAAGDELLPAAIIA